MIPPRHRWRRAVHVFNDQREPRPVLHRPAQAGHRQLPGEDQRIQVPEYPRLLPVQPGSDRVELSRCALTNQRARPRTGLAPPGPGLNPPGCVRASITAAPQTPQSPPHRLRHVLPGDPGGLPGPPGGRRTHLR